MPLKTIFLVLSVIFSLITPVIGIISIVKGRFRPQRMTRFLFLLITTLFFVTLLAQGDRNAIFLASTQFLASLVIFILSLKKGVGGKSKFDLSILTMVVMTLIVWKTTNNAALGLLCSLVTDFCAILPTLIKAWKMPQTESWHFYMSDVIAATFNIMSITLYSTQNLIFPSYILGINALITVIILIRKKHVWLK